MLQCEMFRSTERAAQRRNITDVKQKQKYNGNSVPVRDNQANIIQVDGVLRDKKTDGICGVKND